MDTQLEELKARLDRAEHRLERASRRARAQGVLALGAVTLAAFATARPAALAQAPGVTLASLLTRIVALEQKTAPITHSGTDMTITGVNVHIVSGSGSTSDGTLDSSFEPIPGKTLTGLGNLIIGYNTSRSTLFGAGADARTGSHNLIIGDFNNYTSFGGTVIGLYNATSAIYASVGGGSGNTASGAASSVSGGLSATASGVYSVAAGGENNTAGGVCASVTGGLGNRAGGDFSTVSAGTGNTASNLYASVSGGIGNTASEFASSVSGGSGGAASGFESSVSGGQGLTETDTYGWAAGAYHSP